MTDLQEKWTQAWAQALACWSRYTQLREPRWLSTTEEAAAEGLTGSFAMITLCDHRVIIRLDEVLKHGLQDYAVEILAHEIGHHVYAPGDLGDQAVALARARRALPTLTELAPMVVNLYQDLLINDRLVRFHDLRLEKVYRALAARRNEPANKVWSVYLRAYEILWGLARGSLGGATLSGSEEGDSQLIARLVRVYAKDWLDGVGGFAALLFPYLQSERGEAFAPLLDTILAGRGGEVPAGLSEDDNGVIIHPVNDPRVVGTAVTVDESADEVSPPSDATSAQGGAKGQSRQPFEYRQILEALGMKLTEKEAAIKYYKEQALPHLIPFPTRVIPQSTEPLAEGTDPWDIGSPIESVDWLESVLVSPRIFPGMTTVQRAWGVMSGHQPKREPIDLDLYVDCSGSMPNPQRQLSHIALAGAVVVLSALRVGARVQATLWSGAGQFQSTRGFVRDENEILGVLVGYLGGGTAFPNHILRQTYSERNEGDRPVHILVLSDEGIDTMRSADELGNPGMSLSKMALERARGGGTMVLRLFHADHFMGQDFSQQATGMGWNIFPVVDFASMVAFAREFARQRYATEGPQKLGAKALR